jgi:hypothetical protein
VTTTAPSHIAYCVRFGVLTAMAVKIIVFWDVKPCTAYLKDGGSAFPRNVGKYLSDYMASYPRARSNLQAGYCPTEKGV